MDELRQSLTETTSSYCTALLSQMSELVILVLGNSILPRNLLIVSQIDYAAVGECEGISEKQARRRFYRLKAQISSHENDTEAEKQGQKDKGIQDGNDAKENS